jgi:D-alanyl-D-alanine endopeptidase (penicillin-binding protein 7)
MKLFISFCLAISMLLPHSIVLAQTEFNPNYIISDEELQNYNGWTAHDVQVFLESRGSYLARFIGEDFLGQVKSAAEIIYEAALRYQISPKFLLVTLQKEQSLITDDKPSQRQIDWATGFAVCDGCSLSDPKVIKYKGFGKQVDGAAAIMRWYYDNKNDKPFIKKVGETISISNEPVTPQNWATAFLYTYTPHLNGNKNFWRIWNNWFAQFYPNGTIITNADNSNYWLIYDGKKRLFNTKTALISRADPNTAVVMAEADLKNYPDGALISFPNYSILKAPSGYYLIDYNYIRPFASDGVVKSLGYNPQEIIDVSESDLSGYAIGPTINSNTASPQGEIYKISDMSDALYLFKDGVLHPIIDPGLIKSNFSNLKTTVKQKKDISALTIADQPVRFADGTLIQIKDSNKLYVIDNGKKRRIADDETFLAMGYKKQNLIQISFVTALSLPEGDPLFVSNSLASSQNKFLGDSEAPVENLFKTKLPSYLVAEYPGGKIISGKNIDQQRPAASIVKIMVAYEALNQDLKLDKSTIYDPALHATVSDRLKLTKGEKISNKDLLYSFLIAPINNAAKMIAQSTGLSEKKFITAMNTRLENWGADNTKIYDTTGLSENNVSSARDVLKIFNNALANKTIRDSMSKTSYTFTELLTKDSVSKHKITNFNNLMLDIQKNYKIIASNTGYTQKSGAIMVALVESKKTNDQYIIVTMGDSDYNNRFTEPDRLAQWAINFKATADIATVSN